MTILAAEIDLPGGKDVQETATFFIDRLGFRLNAIFPADSPRIATLSGHSMRLRLIRGADLPPGSLRILTENGDEASLTAPNGTKIDFAPVDPWPAIPENKPERIFTPPATGEADWHGGRAGMQYRDLIPGRWGGRFIASHIRIPDGGPVPDYVHYHKVRFQMIFCAKGWVKVAYEDQGDPITMRAGEVFLQPPEIRHRVLEASPGMEVVEIGCPAEHPTQVDHILSLPTGRTLPDRDYGGQRFVYHDQSTARWDAWSIPGIQARDLGIKAATDGLATVRVLKADDDASGEITPASEFQFFFALAGRGRIDGAEMTSGSSLALPPSGPVSVQLEAGFEALEVFL